MIVHDLGRLAYSAGLELQKKARARVLEGGPDELLLLEHDPVVTLGRRGGVVDSGALRSLQTPVIETDRGGLATWHGPGQLVGYPIVDLSRAGLKVPRFVEILGEILACEARSHGVEGAAYDCARPGVYVENRKLAAIGLHLHRGVSSHGFAFNVNNTLEGFNAIVPCGLNDLGVTTLEREIGRQVDVEVVLRSVRSEVLSRLSS